MCGAVIGQDFMVESAPALAWYFHAGVDGSGCLHSGWGLTAVYLVRLCVLSLAVDHSNAQTQTLGKRLGPASTHPKLNMAASRGYSGAAMAPSSGFDKSIDVGSSV